MDTYVAPNVTGYTEFAQFYRRMAQEVSWMKIPSMPGIQIDPRAAEGMSELQKNSDALKGFPMLSYVSMTLSATANGQTQTLGSQDSSALIRNRRMLRHHVPTTLRVRSNRLW